ncbi:gfo/Idh/MocA family oxidoreductase [Clostridium sp. chh4-2]|uniref:Gfo/Idh/MocA family protein n=1 Tax=Clostridium sp. chh4-2 TaxID=2067550 RepID=UPI000CCF9E04|nr:Gfo/Idh/MocA family oxidoreductase [Clostridium sp. chh4-2]PNV61371.1 gfo/Idh/MocA family oxidoreductase [Clostridium sp. chh4-2]
MIRIGIIGVGNTIGIAGFHIRSYKLCEDAVITAVYDILPERAQNYIDKFELKDAKVCQSEQEVFENCDAVSICTPNATHVELAVAALKAGCHVLCEKPFAPTEEECKEAVKYAKLTDKVAMIGLCYRDIPGFVYMKQLIEEGKIGKVFFVREEQGGDRIANPDVKLEWRMQKDLSGPGALADFGSHMIDICDYLLRDSCGKIREVQCMQDILIEEREEIRNPGVMGKVTNDDVACWTCRTEKGTLYNFTASRIGAVFMLEIIGAGGKMIFNGARPFELTLQLKDQDGGYKSAPEVVPVPEECFGPDAAAPREHMAINFYYEIRQFLDTIQKKRSTQLTFERGRYIQEVLEAAQRSADTGETVKLF